MKLELPNGWTRHPTMPVVSHDACGHVVTKGDIWARGLSAFVHLCQRGGGLLCSTPNEIA